jgi:hypothetical protein
LQAEAEPCKLFVPGLSLRTRKKDRKMSADTPQIDMEKARKMAEHVFGMLGGALVSALI